MCIGSGDRAAHMASTSDFFHLRCESHVYGCTRDHQLESRMREIRQSGSEGGGGREASPYPYMLHCAPSRAVLAIYFMESVIGPT